MRFVHISCFNNIQVALRGSKFSLRHFGFPLLFITEAVLHTRLSSGAHLRSKYHGTQSRSTPGMKGRSRYCQNVANAEKCTLIGCDALCRESLTVSDIPYCQLFTLIVPLRYIGLNTINTTDIIIIIINLL
jgi:hypothetical protein